MAFEALASGRYVLGEKIAAGGTAVVHLGRLHGEAGFSRLVAIKRLHPQFAQDPEFVSMFLDEARLASRIHHPNVVPILNVVSAKDELLLVMDFVPGASLATVLRILRERGESIPLRVAVAVSMGVLQGLAASHAAVDEVGRPLGIVHRDVSPQNILVGSDGIVRLVDFGVAKAAGRLQTTREGQIKGKCAYMSPEQLRGREVDCRTDVYASGVVLWETLVGTRLFSADSPEGTMTKVLEESVLPPSHFRPDVPRELDAVVLRAVRRMASERYPTAEAMERELEAAVVPASAREVREWLEARFAEHLQEQAAMIARADGGGPRGAADTMPSEVVVITDFDAPGEAPSVETPVPARSHRARYAWLYVAAMVALVLGGVVVVRSLDLRTNAHVPAAAASSPPASSPAGSVAASPPTATSAPVASTSVTAPTASSLTPGAPASVTPATDSVRRSPGRAPTAAKNCRPPYTIGADGIRHPKPNCI